MLMLLETSVQIPWVVPCAGSEVVVVGTGAEAGRVSVGEDKGEQGDADVERERRDAKE